MVTDPPPDDEDARGGDGDGSTDEDPIEEVDFWDEVGESRPIEEEDLQGGDPDASPRTQGPDAPRDEPLLPDAEDRWPGVDIDESGGDDEPGYPPSPEAAAERSEARGSARDEPDPTPEPEGSGAPTDRREPEAPAPGEASRGSSPEPAAEAEPASKDAPEPPAGPESDAGDAPEPEPETGRREPRGRPADAAPEPEAPPTGPAEGEAADDATEVVAGPDVAEDDPEIPRLRERGPVEAGPEPREGVPEADGPCHLCGDDADDEARYACVSCERPACPSHMWVMFGLCAGCATEEDIRKLRGERSEEDWAGFLGIKWVN